MKHSRHISNHKGFEIRELGTREKVPTFELFKPHHYNGPCLPNYKPKSFNMAADCYVFENQGRPEVFMAALSFFGKVRRTPSYPKQAYIDHVLAWLPDVSPEIAMRFCDHIAKTQYLDRGRRFFGNTPMDLIGEYRNESNNWISTLHDGEDRKHIAALYRHEFKA